MSSWKNTFLSLLNQFSLELSDGGTNHAYKPWEQVQAPPQTFCFTSSVPFEHLLLGGVTRCLQSWRHVPFTQCFKYSATGQEPQSDKQGQAQGLTHWNGQCCWSVEKDLAIWGKETTLSSISQCRKWKQTQTTPKIIGSILLSYFPSQGPKHPKNTFISKCVLIIPVTGACPSLGDNLTVTAGPAKEMKELWDKAADKNSGIKLLQYQSPDLPRNAEHTEVTYSFAFWI